MASRPAQECPDGRRWEGVSTDTAAPATPEALRRQFSEIELAHALRATAAQQLRVAAAARGRTDPHGAHVAALEQAIADRIDRVVQARRAAVRPPAGVAPAPPDELARRRRQRITPTGSRASA